MAVTARGIQRADNATRFTVSIAITSIGAARHPAVRLDTCQARVDAGSSSRLAVTNILRQDAFLHDA
jgi:hypothetical protein